MQCDTIEDRPPQPNISSTHLNDLEKKRKSIPVRTPSPGLLTEIELMDILNQQRCPQIVRKKITQWISKVHTTPPGFNFSELKYRKPQVVLKEIESDSSLSLFQNHKFESSTINWLPDNTPIQIHLRPFQKALFSLLKNPLISRLKRTFRFPIPPIH